MFISELQFCTCLLSDLFLLFLLCVCNARNISRSSVSSGYWAYLAKEKYWLSIDGWVRGKSKSLRTPISGQSIRWGLHLLSGPISNQTPLSPWCPADQTTHHSSCFCWVAPNSGLQENPLCLCTFCPGADIGLPLEPISQCLHSPLFGLLKMCLFVCLF